MKRYEVIERAWDGERTLYLLDRESNAAAEVVPAAGFHLFRYEVRNEGYIDAPQRLEQLREQSSRCGVPILFPPGRVKLAAFSYEGREYRLPVNREPHHSHGELRYKPWKVVAAGADEAGGAYVSAEFDFADHPDMLAYFQHAAVFRFTYRLYEGRLTLSGTITNPGERAMPLALGFHPYFSFREGEAGDVEVALPAKAQWPLDAEGFVSGLPEATPLINALQRGVRVAELPGYKGGSQCFVMEPGEQRCELRYRKRGTKLVYEIGDMFPQHVLFTPAWSEAVSLEPYTCIANAFNEPYAAEQTGALGIAGGETFTFHWSLSVQAL